MDSRCGVVTQIEDCCVWVEIERTSACSQCHARSSCMTLTGESKETIKIDVKDATIFKVGDAVKVKVDKGSARLSVVLAYVLPLVVLVLILSLSSFIGFSDDVAGILAVVFLVIYYYVLYLYRGRVDKKMSFKIEK
ncbi:MAG: SoxR reducing system RseC family protein [Rikenellaceae bacterium]